MDGNNKPTLAVDFDGVLHTYDEGWQDGKIYGELITGAKEALVKLAVNYSIVVFTARENLNPVYAALRLWGVGGFITEVTNTKPIAIAYIDDRGITFKNNWPEIVQELNS